MPRTHPSYATEYRRRIIELARTGRGINELAREFEPSANAIREWVKQAELGVTPIAARSRDRGYRANSPRHSSFARNRKPPGRQPLERRAGRRTGARWCDSRRACNDRTGASGKSFTNS
jgi:hypothetical protein